MSGASVRVRVVGEHYALPVQQVLEVADLSGVAPVPGAPATVVGVGNLRGQVIPMIDLAMTLGLGGGEPSRCVVVESGELRAGLLVDEVLDVEELPPASEQVESEYLLGACLLDGVLVAMLDVGAVLSLVGGGGAAS
jgi:chemotaxis signal transduction protein